MKWDNTDLKVGLLVLGALLVGVASFIWVGRIGRQNVAPLYTDVTDVQGISAESPVFLNGFNVGRVSEVQPRVGDGGQLLFRLRMDILWRLENAPMPLHRGLRARIQPPTLDIGRGSIVLEMPAEDPAARAGAKSGAVALRPGEVIPSVKMGGTTNRMQLVVDSVGRDLRLVIAQVETLVQSLNVTVATATSTIRSANSVLASVSEDLPGIMGGVRANLASADSLIKGLHSVTPATVATLDSVRALLGDSRVAITRATEFLDANEPQIASTLANLDNASAVLSNLLREVSRRPIKAITGVRPPEITRPDVRQAGAAAGTTTATKNGKP
jgi:ABC-type transporter Mla subunit MlaD